VYEEDLTVSGYPLSQGQWNRSDQQYKPNLTEEKKDITLE
jgi:hypothetical protein